MTGGEHARVSSARAACEAFWSTVEPGIKDPDAAWRWARSQRAERGWEAAAKAAAAETARERDEARAERDKARADLAGLIRELEHVATSLARGMYAARIDCWRGDPASAAAALSEGLDGYDGPEWDGTETGEQWWERTKAEEGLTATATREQPGSAEIVYDAGMLIDLLSLAGVTVTPADVDRWTADQREAARDWAAREHLHASDNPVERTPKPQFLAEVAR